MRWYSLREEGRPVLTNTKVWAGVIVTILIAALVFQTVPVLAQSYDPEEDLPKTTGVEKALTKLGRGLANIMLGWAEIPVTFDKGVKKGKPLGYLLGVAPVLGTARAVMRTSSGVYEVVSFPFSSREVNYEAVLEPEFIF
jgi:putative exosortase-associated protein (TIGR04073 family)